MDLFDLEHLPLAEDELRRKIEEVTMTNEFVVETKRELFTLGAVLSIRGKLTDYYTLLKSQFIYHQSSVELQLETVLAAYAASNYREAFFLAKDMVPLRPPLLIYQILLKICINHLSLAEYAVSFAKTGLKQYVGNAELTFGLAVAYSHMGDLSLYHKERVTQYEKALGLLEELEWSAHPDYLFHLGLVQAKLGTIKQARLTAAEGYNKCQNEQYSALLALLLVASNDFTSALQLVENELAIESQSVLLKAVR